MEKLREEFLKETITVLTEIRAKIETLQSPDDFLLDVFHKIHTIKGSASTLGLTIPSRLAHEIESLLKISKNQQTVNKEWLIEVLKESFWELINLFKQTLNGEEVSFPQDVSAKINYLLQMETKDEEVVLPPSFPENLLKKLSSFEVKSVQSALLKEKIIVLTSVVFELENFTERFKELRNRLSEESEILATFSTPNPPQIIFQILLATTDSQQIFSIVNNYQGKIEFETFKNDIEETEESATNLERLFKNAVNDGKKVARLLGKSVKIEINSEEKEVSDNYIEPISVSLLHLVRNAIAHGIEKPMERIAKNKSAQGVVKIEFSRIEKGFRLAVIDNGQGIDMAKIKQIAEQENLMESKFEINEEEVKKLIFKSGFSTANVISEISGRGVGLQAVELEIEKIKGKIRVYSKEGLGTIFEIYLPT